MNARDNLVSSSVVWRARAATYLLTAAISLVAAVILLKLWSADLRVPFDYGGDALSFSIVVKSVIDNGWYLHTPQVGAPFGLDMHDFPFADSLHLLVIKGMSLFTSDWALLFNVYFLLGFPLIAMAAMAVFRHYRVPFRISLVISVLYAFLPSRLLKGENHIFMDVFFQVPLAILVVLWVCEEGPPLVREREGRWPGVELRSGRSIAALVICLATSCMGLYYAFFTAFLLVVGGAWVSLRRRSPSHLLAGVLLAGVIGGGLAGNGLPTLIYKARHGANPQVAVRQSFDAELYALKPVELVLPVDGHRIKPLAGMKQRYQAGPPHLGEEGVSLGVMGTIGLLALLGSLLLGASRERPRAELFRTLAFLNVSMLILGVVGGLGSLLALLVSPQIRTYARVNVVIGFLALFALALLLERLALRRRRLAEAVVPLVLAIGLVDQATPRAVRAYAAVKAAYQSDAELVRRIEAGVPAGSMIFQLPHQSFPEARALHGMGPYDAVRPYLHSRSLRWGQPAMRGREGDAWLQAVTEREPKRLVQTISEVGFEGILVDREGYADHGVEIERALRQVLGVDPVMGSTGRLSFFALGPYNGAGRAKTADEPERRRDLALHPVYFTWQGGFSGTESLERLTWRWCSAAGELAIDNGGRFERPVSIRMTAFAANPPASLEIDGDLTSARFELGQKGTPVALALKVPPGHHTIRFRSNGQPADAPGDPRTLVWRAEDPVAEEVPPLGENGRPVP